VGIKCFVFIYQCQVAIICVPEVDSFWSA